MHEHRNTKKDCILRMDGNHENRDWGLKSTCLYWKGWKLFWDFDFDFWFRTSPYVPRPLIIRKNILSQICSWTIFSCMVLDHKQSGVMLLSQIPSRSIIWMYMLLQDHICYISWSSEHFKYGPGAYLTCEMQMHETLLNLCLFQNLPIFMHKQSTHFVLTAKCTWFFKN